MLKGKLFASLSFGKARLSVYHFAVCFFIRHDAFQSSLPGEPSIKNRVPLQNGKRTGKQGKAVPTLLLANLRTLPASHLASKVAWSHFSLVGEICPQAPLNDFCKIGCAPAELSSPAACQRIAALCEYVIDTFSVSGYT